ncbi:MAG: hypothetical protein HC859_08070 [Bacteroidia bacterium]|nr:hypothetical protein [Bacteroidia bacterium]
MKKVARILFLIALLILAAFGVGITGAFLPNTRERFMNNEIKIELVEKKNEDEDEVDEDNA